MRTIVLKLNFNSQSNTGSEETLILDPMSATIRISVNGQTSLPESAFLPLPDDGLFRGDGVFEVARVRNGRPFALGPHLDRMERSAAAIELPLARTELTGEIDALLRELEQPDCLLRIIQTRAGNRVISLEQIPVHDETETLATVTYSPTVILNGVKSLSYAANMQATRIAQASGASEALFVRSDRTVLEPPTSSIFWATSSGDLRTPSLDCGVLDSITRRKLIEVLEVEQGKFQLEDLLAAHEAFLVSTTRDVQPIARIDETQLAESPGPITRDAADRFRRVVETETGSTSRT